MSKKDIAETVPDIGPDDSGEILDGETRDGWQWENTNEGLHRKVKKGDEWVNRWICSPIEPLAFIRDMEGGGMALFLRVKSCSDGDWHEATIPRKLLAGDGMKVRELLLSLGAQISMVRGDRDSLSRYLGFVRPSGRVRSVDTIGWHDDRHVMPGDVVEDLKSGKEAYLISGVSSSAHNLQVKGTLDDWRDNVSRLASGNTRLLLSLGVAFASSLLYVTGDDSGGFHFYGISSRGKSTSLDIAGSVWGGGSAGYVQSWKATDNALESVAREHSDILLAMDELSQAQANSIAQSIYMLGNGRGKIRQNIHGTTRRTARWRTLFLSNGEILIEQKIAEAGGKIAAGVGVRVIDIAADVGIDGGLFEELHGRADGAIFSKEIKAATRAYYGTAGRAFVAKISEDIAASKEVISDLRAAFLDGLIEPEMSGQVRRVLDRFALVAVAGELAIEFGLIACDQGEIQKAARSIFGEWVAARGGVGLSEVASAKKNLREFLAAHGSARFEPWHEKPNNRVTMNRAGWVRYEVLSEGTKDDPEYYFTATAWKAEILQGMSGKIVNQALVDDGILPEVSAVKYWVPSDGSHRLFKVSKSFMASE